MPKYQIRATCAAVSSIACPEPVLGAGPCSGRGACMHGKKVASVGPALCHNASCLWHDVHFHFLKPECGSFSYPLAAVRAAISQGTGQISDPLWQPMEART
jgi:hypothetical protein